MLTIHGEVGDNFSQPLIYALLPNKKKITYIRVLRKLKQLAKAQKVLHLISTFKHANSYFKVDPYIFKVTLNPKSWMVDFELGFINAIQAVFGVDVDIDGCLFHYEQVQFHIM